MWSNSTHIIGNEYAKCAATWKTLREFFLHLHIFMHSSHDLVILLLGIYPSKMKMCSHKNLYVDVYNRLLLKSEKQRKNLETGKLWYIYSTAYSSVIKRNKLLIHLTMGRNLNCIKLSERRQNEKATYYIITTIWYLGKEKAIVTIGSVVARLHRLNIEE